MTTLTQMREAAALLPADDPVRKALISGERQTWLCGLIRQH